MCVDSIVDVRQSYEERTPAYFVASENSYRADASRRTLSYEILISVISIVEADHCSTNQVIVVFLITTVDDRRTRECNTL